MAVALWFAVPARRQVIVWTLAMLVGALAAFSGVFASFVNITNLGQVIGYTADNIAGRYLLPVLLAWFATMMTVFFAEPPSVRINFFQHGCQAVPCTSTPAGPRAGGKTSKKQGWQATALELIWPPREVSARTFAGGN